MAKSHAAGPAVYAALCGNDAIATNKGFAAAWTGSSSMPSEAVHSLVDTFNGVLLLYGLHRAGRRPDASHPLGYRREIYFWSFVVALLVGPFCVLRRAAFGRCTELVNVSPDRPQFPHPEPRPTGP